MINKIVKKIYNFIFSNNPIFYKHKFDGISTRANLGFLEEVNFKQYSEEAAAFVGRDYKFYLRLHQVLWCAATAKNVKGDFVELGTGRGYLFSAVASYSLNNELRKDIYLFDTFLPYKTDKSTGEQKEGQYISSFYAENYESIARKFGKYNFVHLIKGRCPESLSEVYGNGRRAISFLHVDLNFHEAEISSLDYLWPYITLGAIILLDDYANPGRELQQQKHKKYFESKGLEVLTTATGQGLILVNVK
jgi:O-methyltransferase